VNITQRVINLAGGCLEICGQKITDTALSDKNSAIEAICVQGNTGLQVVRQLTATALNCVISGGNSECTGSSIHDIFTECNEACAAGTLGSVPFSCVDALDCFNNGGTFNTGTGTCQFGTCSVTGSACGTGFPPCLVGTCVPSASCHTQNFGTCQDAGREPCDSSLPCPNGATCGDPGPAGSPKECNAANQNTCTVVGTGQTSCDCGSVGSCP
jgi:hypothetical protein